MPFFFKVNLNFFCEKHGKNNRDVHFANISRFVEAESLIKQITTADQVVDAILKRQQMANENKKGNSKNPGIRKYIKEK